MNIQTVTRRFRRFLRATEAVSALEYAILVGVITVAVGAAVTTFSETISDAIDDIGTEITTSAENRVNEE